MSNNENERTKDDRLLMQPPLAHERVRIMYYKSLMRAKQRIFFVLQTKHRRLTRMAAAQANNNI